jgi:endo-1,4-beta-mannosidase
MKTQTFQIGVNYLSARSGIRFWRELDSGELREDLDRLAEWRLNPVRLFLMWEHFQPDHDTINLKALKRLHSVADCAAERGLKLWITLFTGHLFGVNWLPGWMVGQEHLSGPCATYVNDIPVKAAPKNAFTDPSVLRSQRLLLREVCAVMRDHPALFVYDLGERTGSLFHADDVDQIRRFLGELHDEIRRSDETSPITVGLQATDLTDPTGFRPAVAAEFCDFLSIAALPSEIEWSEGITDISLPLFAAEMVRFLSGGKKVWVSSIGVPTTREKRNDPSGAIREGAAEDLARLWVECLRQNGIPGALWWCYADIHPRQWRSPPFDRKILERSFGLLRDGWQPKPTLNGLRSVDRTLNPHYPDPSWIDLDPDQYWRNPKEEIKRLYKRFRDQIVIPR